MVMLGLIGIFTYSFLRAEDLCALSLIRLAGIFGMSTSKHSRIGKGSSKTSRKLYREITLLS